MLSPDEEEVERFRCPDWGGGWGAGVEEVLVVVVVMSKGPLSSSSSPPPPPLSPLGVRSSVLVEMMLSVEHMVVVKWQSIVELGMQWVVRDGVGNKGVVRSDVIWQ